MRRFVEHFSSWQLPSFAWFVAYLINIFTGGPGWNRQHHRQTINPTEKLISMNLFKILWVVTWAWLLLTSVVMETVRGQKRAHFGTLIQRLVNPTVPVLCHFSSFKKLGYFLKMGIVFVDLNVASQPKSNSKLVDYSFYFKKIFILLAMHYYCAPISEVILNVRV